MADPRRHLRRLALLRLKGETHRQRLHTEVRRLDQALVQTRRVIEHLHALRAEYVAQEAAPAVTASLLLAARHKLHELGQVLVQQSGRVDELETERQTWRRRAEIQEQKLKRIDEALHGADDARRREQERRHEQALTVPGKPGFRLF